MPHDAGLPDPAGPLPPPHRDFKPVAGRVEPAPPAPAPTPPPALSAGPDLAGLLVGLRRRWPAAVLLGGTLAATAAAAAWYLLTPKNVAFARIKVALDEGIIVSSRGTSASDFKTYVQTTAAEITSRPVIWAALKRDEVRRLNLEARESDPVTYVEEWLKAETKDNSEVVTITMTDPDPVVATTVANAIKEAYMDEIVYAKKVERGKQVTELEKAFGEANDALKSKRERLIRLAEKLGVTDPTALQQQRQETLNTLRDARHRELDLLVKLADARAALDAHKLRIKSMRDKPPDYARMADDLLDSDADAKRIQARIDYWEGIYQDYVDKGAEDSPTAGQALSRVRTLRTQLERRRRQMVAKARRSAPDGREAREQAEVTRAQLQKGVDELLKVRAQLRAQIADLAKQAARAPVLAEEYDTVKEAIKRDEVVLADLGGKLEREKLQLRADSRITRFQDAELMKKDIKKQLLGTAVAPLVVFFGVCMALAYLDHRQRRVRNAGQVSRGLGIRVVGAVPDRPHLEREVAGAAEGDVEAETVLESIDAIRTLLLHEAGGQSTRLVMVTSASAGEGKTTLASHLAGSLARAGRKTLLVDCDLRRPALHELFELPVQPGFSEVVLGEVEVADAVQETDLDNLWLVPAGQWDREVVHALARDGLEAVFEKLRAEFDFILLDSHPVLAAADSLLIGRQVDAVLLSVLREVSQMPRVYAAAQQLGAVGIRVLGAVVNGTSPEDVFTSPVAAPAAA